MIQWIHYPRSVSPPRLSTEIVAAFTASESKIGSGDNQLNSDEVLAHVRPHLEALGFVVETGKKKTDRIEVPVLFGLNGAVEKSFQADAFHPTAGYVLEVEAGRAVVNNQFLKDFFQACMMQDAQYLVIAVRKLYEGGGRRSKDFNRVLAFFDTLFASERLNLPLNGIMILGY